VPLLSPAATIRRRTHAFAFNLASVGREDLLDPLCARGGGKSAKN
jgi:hypothetical protein